MPDLTPDERAVVDRARVELDQALDDVRGRLLADSGTLKVHGKPDGTVVTDADRDVDDHLAQRLVAAFPDHGMLSEERATRAPDTRWTWIVDPIDGTSNFTCRLPYWCVSVALTLDGYPVLGVVDAPELGRRYRATLGQGAEVEHRTTSADGTSEVREVRGPLQVREPLDWRSGRNGHVPVMLTTATTRHARAAGLSLNPRVMGSTALDLAVVAEGVAAGSVAMVPKVWDIAAGALLVEEAGGAVITIDGEPLLPIVAGQEQASRAAITAAGPTEPSIRELAEALLRR